MPDSSKQPIRGADLQALQNKLAQLKADAAGVLEQLSAEADTLTQRLAQAEKATQSVAGAEERVTKARAKRPPASIDAAAKQREATATERLAAAEERAARAAEARATAEQAAAKAASEAATAVERSALASSTQQRQLGPGARFYAGAGGTSDLFGAQALARAAERERLVNEVFQSKLALPPASQIQLGPATTGATSYNQYGGIGAAGGGAAGASRFAQSMEASTAAEKAAAASHNEAAAAAHKAAQAQEDYVNKVVGKNAKLREFGGAVDYNSMRLAQSSNQYQRNGYLTSEFINAAARGEVTIRELGTQIGGTVAKFAGWTAAASAVYGAVRAIQQLGKGALASESGVNQLSRIVTVDLPGGADQAKQKFRELSREFNLPISDVVDAVYGMAKAFHGDLPQAFEASRSALFAVKVGELSAADATRYLTAIVNGFGLSAAQLGDVFDGLNQVQNRFGGNITNIAAGVAKAAGSFHAAGGDYLTLIKLIEAGVKVTGSSGENVGTAFSRSAGRVLTDAGREAIKKAGLDPNLSYPELFGQALAKSKGASNRTVAAIARSLIPSGGQFARILIPILQSPDLLGQIGTELQKRAGSAERERARAVKSPSEQLKRLTTDAQQLGSALGESGVLTPLLALVRGTDELLHGLTDVVTIADQLAGPFKGALIPILEIAAAIKLMRRFDLGSALPAGTPGTPYASLRGGLQRPPGDLFDAQIGKGSGDVRNELNRNYQSSLSSANSAAIRGNAYGAEAKRLEEEDLARAASLEEQVAVAEQIDAAQAQAAKYQAQYERALIEANAIQAEIAGREEQLNAYRQLRKTGLDKEAAAIQAGYVLRPSLETNNAGSPTPLAGARSGASAAAGASASTAIGAQAAAQEEAIAAQSRLSVGLQRLGLSGTAIAAGAGGAKVAAEAAVGGLRAAAAGAVSLVAALGPLDLLLAAAFGVPLVLDAAKELHKKQQSAEAKIRAGLGGAAGVRQNAKQVTSHGGVFAQVGDVFKGAAQSVDDLAHLRVGRALVEPDPNAAREDFAKRAQQVADELARQQPQGRLLDISAIRRTLSSRFNDTQDATSRIEAIQDAIRQAQTDYIALAQKTFGKKFKQGPGAAAAQAALLRSLHEQLLQEQQAQAQTTGPGSLGFDQLQTYTAGTASRLQFQGPTAANATRLQAAVSRLRQLAAGGHTDAGFKKIADNIQALQQAAQAIADGYTQKAQAITDPVARAHVQLRGVQAAKRALGGDQLERRLRDARQQATAANAQLDRDERAIQQLTAAASAESGARTSQGVGPIASRLSKLQARAEKDRERVGKAKNLMQVVEAILRNVFGTLNQAGAQAAQDLRQANEDLYSAKTDYLSARAGGGLAGDQVRVGRLQSDPYRKVKKGSAEWYQQQTEILNTRQSIAQEQQQQSKDAADKAKQAADAAKQAADQARQDAQALVTAQADYALSLTTDPVKQARIRFQEAERSARYASGRADQLEAKANINNTRRDLKNATYQSRLDDIDFYASIGKLSHDAEIAQLQALLKRIKGNKDLRRQIQQKLYDLKHQAADDTSLDINVGDLHLPTIYDVRRLRKQGLAAATTIQQSNTYQFSVRNDSDVERLGGELGSIHGSSVRAAMRSAGLR